MTKKFDFNKCSDEVAATGFVCGFCYFSPVCNVISKLQANQPCTCNPRNGEACDACKAQTRLQSTEALPYQEKP